MDSLTDLQLLAMVVASSLIGTAIAGWATWRHADRLFWGDPPSR